MMNTCLNIPHLPQLRGFHKQMIYHCYSSMMTHYHHQNHLLHLPMLHHLFVQVLNNISLRQNTEVLFRININTKDRMVDSSEIRIQKWRDKW